MFSICIDSTYNIFSTKSGRKVLIILYFGNDVQFLSIFAWLTAHPGNWQSIHLNAGSLSVQFEAITQFTYGSVHRWHFLFVCAVLWPHCHCLRTALEVQNYCLLKNFDPQLSTVWGVKLTIPCDKCSSQNRPGSFPDFS